MQTSTNHLRTPRRRSTLFAFALTAWTVCAGFGLWAVSGYGFTTVPDATTRVPREWPVNSTIERIAARPTLLVFLHPLCPCSRATISELERLVVATPPAELPAIRVVVAAPADADDRWWSSPLVVRASQLPNSILVRDVDGQEAARFGVRVSGTTLLFDRAGARTYAGGVTIARGHAGDSAGLAAVAQLLHNPAADVVAVPPFGCELVLPASATTCHPTTSLVPSAEGDRR
jgi:hypothetical protein